MYLIDTNVVSELRKGARCDSRVIAWRNSVQPHAVYLSVLVIGELAQGIELAKRRDPRKGAAYEAWLAQLEREHKKRILPVTRAVARVWGPLNAPDKVPVIDGLLAATALVHDLTLVTRNVRDVARTGARVLNPFE
jgi:predicted nucleic acid-binding protein